MGATVDVGLSAPVAAGCAGTVAANAGAVICVCSEGVGVVTWVDEREPDKGPVEGVVAVTALQVMPLPAVMPDMK